MSKCMERAHQTFHRCTPDYITAALLSGKAELRERNPVLEASPPHAFFSSHLKLTDMVLLRLFGKPWAPQHFKTLVLWLCANNSHSSTSFQVFSLWMFTGSFGLPLQYFRMCQIIFVMRPYHYRYSCMACVEYPGCGGAGPL